VKKKDNIYASIHFSKDSTKRIYLVMDEYKKDGAAVTIESAVNKLIEETAYFMNKAKSKTT